jgi:heme A synthase
MSTDVASAEPLERSTAARPGAASFAAPPRWFARASWSVLAYTIGVIVWGAFVRASKSGAGCGDHWPDCKGRIIPSFADTATLIEYVHRVTSGVSGLLVLGLAVASLFATPRGHVVRRYALLSAVFIVTESALGMLLVKFQYVAEDASVGRAIWMALHLVNTFLLLAWMTLVAWYGSGRPHAPLRSSGALGKAMFAALGAALVVATFGAQAALADTLFPAASIAHGVAQDMTPGGHFLLKLRMFHPIVALGLAVYLVVALSAASAMRPTARVKRLSTLVFVLLGVQIAFGFVNLAFLAPVWMQLLHLLNADLLWVTLVVLTAASIAAPRSKDDDAARERRAQRVAGHLEPVARSTE